MIALIDADSIMFQACFNVETPEQAFEKYDDLIQTCVIECFADDHKAAIKGDNNFRYVIDPNYKSHRPALPDEVGTFLGQVREHALKMGAVPAHGMEADDLVCHWAYDLAFDPDECTVCHIDKDLDMIPGAHFNYHWNKMLHYTLTVEEADAWFYKQLLMGDKADGIECIHGIGPKKADNIIDFTDYGKRLTAVMDVWARRYGKGWQDAMLKAGNLLWMRRFTGDTFTFTDLGGTKHEPIA